MQAYLHLKRIFLSKWMHFFLLGCILISACSLLFYEHPAVKSLQFISFDTFNRIHPREPTDEVVVIDIDEVSLGALGQWPWPRHVVGEIISNLSDMGAKVIAFDMVFAEEDRTSPEHFIRNLSQDERKDDIAASLAGLPSNDEVFGEQIKRTRKTVTAFTSAKASETRRSPLLRRELRFKKDDEAVIEDLKKYAFHLRGAATNLPVISRYAAGSGAFLAVPENDGIIRRIPIILRFQNRETSNMDLYPALSLEVARVGVNRRDYLKVGQRVNFDKIAGDDNKNIRFFDTEYFINIGTSDLIVPLNYDGMFWVHYRPRDPADYISAYKAYDATFHDSIRSKVKDKYVFIASSAEGLKDLRSTPLDVYVPGVEVHMNVLEQILQQRFLTRPEVMKSAEVLYVFAAGGLMILLAPFINSLVLGLLCVCIIVTAAVGALGAYMDWGLLIDPLYPSMSVLLLYFASVIFSYVRAEAEKATVREAFGLYISPDFMEELTKDPEKLTLGGEIRDLTVMFSDIRNFTTISESMTPQALINTMNDFLTPMSDEVMRTRGTIDKYMGDAMMAFWNAPLDDANHARHACIAALRMVEVLEPVNEKLKAEAAAEERSFYRLNAGIGLNTGPCAVGNMGSRQRFAYSTLGDAVNLASRLEGQTKNYGINILCGEETVKQVPDFTWFEMDLIQVKGKDIPVRVYFLYGDDAAAKETRIQQWQGLHNDMLAAYRAQDFDKALEIMEECRRLDKDLVLDAFYDLYEQRIEAFKVNPPHKNWDGVYIATSK